MVVFTLSLPGVQRQRNLSAGKAKAKDMDFSCALSAKGFGVAVEGQQCTSFLSFSFVPNISLQKEQVMLVTSAQSKPPATGLEPLLERGTPLWGCLVVVTAGSGVPESKQSKDKK